MSDPRYGFNPTFIPYIDDGEDKEDEENQTHYLPGLYIGYRMHTFLHIPTHSFPFVCHTFFFHICCHTFFFHICCTHIFLTSLGMAVELLYFHHATHLFPSLLWEEPGGRNWEICLFVYPTMLHMTHTVQLQQLHNCSTDSQSVYLLGSVIDGDRRWSCIDVANRSMVW